MNCLANVWATRRRTVQPVAMPLTPPFGFNSAVKPCLPISASLISAGTVSCASKLHAATKNSVASLSSNKSFRCSYVHPPSPADDPRGELRKLLMNVMRVKLHRTFRFPIKDLGGQLPELDLRSLVLQLAQSLLRTRSHTCPRQTLPGSRNFPKSHFLTCNPSSLFWCRFTWRSQLLVPNSVPGRSPMQRFPLPTCEQFESVRELSLSDSALTQWSAKQPERQQTEQLPSANLLHWITALGSFVDCFQREL